MPEVLPIETYTVSTHIMRMQQQKRHEVRQLRHDITIARTDSQRFYINGKIEAAEADLNTWNETAKLFNI